MRRKTLTAVLLALFLSLSISCASYKSPQEREPGLEPTVEEPSAEEVAADEPASGSVEINEKTLEAERRVIDEASRLPSLPAWRLTPTPSWRGCFFPSAGKR